MKHIIHRRALSALAVLALSSTTGCSLLAAAGNPGAFWAINDPANLQIVVRRADSALITAAEVNRLLTATPAGSDTPWIASVSPDPKEAAADIKALQNDPDYSVTKARVVATEVWIRTLPNVGATAGEHPSLLAAIDQSLADAFTAVGIKQAEIASLKAQIETEKAAGSADGVSPADKKTHDDQVKTLDKQVDDADAAVAPLRKTFLDQVGAACAKLSNEDKARYAPAVASLLAALDDADMANSAAALKYPIVVKGLPDALKKVVPNIAMEVIEEQIGVRPNLANLKVNITMNGGTPGVSLDGLGDIGALKPADVIKLTATRSIAWFTHTLTLLATIAMTKDRITFERATLTQMQTAFAPAAPSLVVVKIPAFDSPDVTRAAPAKLASLVQMKREKAAGGGFSSPSATAGGDASAEAKGGAADKTKDLKVPGKPAIPGAPKLPGLGDSKLPGKLPIPGAPKLPGLGDSKLPGKLPVPGAPKLPGVPEPKLPGKATVTGVPKLPGLGN